MTNCTRNWGKAQLRDHCAGCWAAIFTCLVMKPDMLIMPQPEFCQDAAFVAATLDTRLVALRAAADGD